MPIHGCCRILSISRTSKCLITSTSTTSITSSSSDHIIQNWQGIPERAGTAILLLHNGEPRSNFYAKQFLIRLLQRHFSLPKWLSSPLVDVYFKLSELPRRCVQELSQYGSYLDTMHELSNKLEKSIQPLIPEFGPIRCLPVCDLEEPISIERQLRHTFRSGLDNLILLNISPLLKSEQLSAQLAEVHKRINAQSSKLMEGEQQEGISEYVLRNLPSSFSLLVIDHLARSESLVQYWAERIIPLLGKYEFIIFTTAYPLFRFSLCANDLEKVSRRIMYAAYKQSPRTTSWRTTFYSGWEQPIGPVFSLSRLNIRTCLSKLAKKGQKGPVLVVPLDSLIQGLNTNTALRSAMEALSTKYKIPADILLPEPLDKALVHSLAELVKHIMLNKEKYSK